jgi:membrane protease YdiL (CAAX protease family)
MKVSGFTTLSTILKEPVLNSEKSHFMNHLESSFIGKNSFWRYIVMFGAVLIASNTIGGIPLFIGYAIKTASSPELIGQIAADPSDMGALGFDPNVGLLLMLFPFVAGIITFILLVKPLNGRTLKQTINGTRSIRWKRFFISAFVWTVLSGLYLIVYIKFNPANFTLNNNTVTLLYLVVISVLLIPFQAAFEEVLFRGYLMQGFSVLIRNRLFPLIMTSVLFGLMHSLNPEVKDFGFLTMMPQYILFGLVFGIATVLDDGIEVAMGAHAANNIFLCIFLTNSSSALQTSALYEQKIVYPWTEFAGLLVAAIVFIIVLKFIFKWDRFSLIWRKIPVQAENIQSE